MLCSVTDLSSNNFFLNSKIGFVPLEKLRSIKLNYRRKTTNKCLKFCLVKLRLLFSDLVLSLTILKFSEH